MNEVMTGFQNQPEFEIMFLKKSAFEKQCTQVNVCHRETTVEILQANAGICAYVIYRLMRKFVLPSGNGLNEDGEIIKENSPLNTVANKILGSHEHKGTYLQSLMSLYKVCSCEPIVTV